MRKPPARKVALALISMMVIAVFMIDSQSKGVSFFSSVGSFFRSIVDNTISWSEMGGGNGKVEILFKALAIIILLGFLLTSAGRRELKRFFDPQEPDEEYYQKDKNVYRAHRIVEGLPEYEDALKKMACDAGIEEVVFRYNQEATIRAVEKSGYVSVIEIGDNFFKGLRRAYNPIYRDLFFRFSVYHELMHVKFHDPMNIVWVKVIAVIAWLIGFVMIGFSSVNPALGLLLTILWFSLIARIAMFGYWSQCAEYRADREALKLLSMLGKDEDIKLLYATFSNCFPSMKKEKKTTITDGIKYAIRVIMGSEATTDASAHPSLVQRENMARSHSVWGVRDYIEVALQIFRKVPNNGIKRKL